MQLILERWINESIFRPQDIREKFNWKFKQRFATESAQTHQALREVEVAALCVRGLAAPLIESVLGVITQEDINSYHETDT